MWSQDQNGDPILGGFVPYLASDALPIEDLPLALEFQIEIEPDDPVGVVEYHVRRTNPDGTYGALRESEGQKTLPRFGTTGRHQRWTFDSKFTFDAYGVYDFTLVVDDEDVAIARLSVRESD